MKDFTFYEKYKFEINIFICIEVIIVKIGPRYNVVVFLAVSVNGGC